MIKKFNIAGIVILFFMLMVGISNPTTAFAATTPSLGQAGTYSILSSTYTNTVIGTTLGGDLGYTTAPATNPTVSGTTYVANGTYAQAGIDQGTALASLNSDACTFTFAAGAINLSTDVTHGAVGVYTPGVYCSTGAMDIGGALTLDGNGTYIFRPIGALTSTANAVVSLTGGALACDAFWTPSQAVTLAANTTFLGTVIANAGITIGANATWAGQALSFGGTVTTDITTFTVPACVVPPVVVVPTPSGGGSSSSYSSGSSTSTPVETITTTTVTTTTTVPGLPKTGFPPQKNTTQNTLLLLGSISFSVATFFIFRKRAYSL